MTKLILILKLKNEKRSKIEAKSQNFLEFNVCCMNWPCLCVHSISSFVHIANLSVHLPLPRPMVGIGILGPAGSNPADMLDKAGYNTLLQYADLLLHCLVGWKVISRESAVRIWAEFHKVVLIWLFSQGSVITWT